MSPPATRDWDARTYERVALAQEQWARPVLDRLALRGDEHVLDAGCGSGRVTKLLIERLPEGRVTAVDGSEAMVRSVRSVLRPGDQGVVADLAQLELDQRVDAVFSNAAFHWVLDHDALFARLATVMRRGGRLEAQCGGPKNVDTFHAAAAAVSRREPYREHFAGWTGPWNFATAEQTEARLERAGFVDVRCWTERRPFTPERPFDYLQAVCLGPHLDRLPTALHDDYVRDVLAEAPEPLVLGYVRLNISARRP